MTAPERREPPVQPVSADTPPLVPARMVNEFVYCPRLAYLEWVQGEWVESSDTVEGRHAHRGGNRDGGKLPPPADVDRAERLHARSITLSSERLGLIARMDLIESDGAKVTPVDYKRGKRPHVERGAYDPERVQLCVQGLLLREHGYECDEGVLYFVGSRERVRIVSDDELVAATRQAVEGLRGVAAEGVIPPPLDDSPKCPRCSLVEVCLPDEVHHLKGADVAPRPNRRALHRSPAALRPGAPRQGVQVGRDAGRDRGRRGVGDRPAGRDLAGRRHGQRLPHDTHPARVDVARDSRDLAQLRRLVLRPHDGQRPQERRAADGPVSGQLRRTNLPAIRPGTREREDPELPHAAPPQLEAARRAAIPHSST